jgi:hypothetical protein
MSTRRQYAMLDEAISTVVDEVLDGQWSRSTTETLMRRAVELSGLPEDLFFRSDPEMGVLYNADSALHEKLLERLLESRLPIVLPPTERYPNGQLISTSAVHYVPADGPDADAEPGLWVRTRDLRREDVARVRALHGWDREPDNEPSG